MKSLAEIQKSFFEDIREGHASCESDLKSFNEITPKERLEVYRQNVFENLRNALELSFPAIWNLVGTQTADCLAHAFIKQHFPKTAYLDEWGDMFPDFIGSVPDLKDLPYLQDVARLEWLKHRARCTEDYEAFDFKNTNIFDYDENSETLQFTVTPSLSLLHSPYNLEGIYQATEPGYEGTISFDEKEAFVLVHRRNYEVLVHWLSNQSVYEMFCFLQKNPSLDALTKNGREDLFLNTFPFIIEQKIIIHVTKEALS